MLGAILAGVGAAAGSQQDTTSTKSGINLAPISANEDMANRSIGQTFGQLSGLVGAGPGGEAVSGAASANASLSEMLKKYAAGGFLPGEQDMATANQFASQAFNPQAIALKQQFVGQQQRAAQLAAQLGRPVNDPIIQAKLSQEYMQGQERLGAQQGAYASQMALQLPAQRLGYTSQLANVQNSLASQAMANRQALLSLGSQVQGAERDWRLQTGTRFGEQSSGGGLKGAITGAIGGLGAGLGAQGMLGQQALQTAQAGYYNSMASAASQPGFGMQAAPQFNFAMGAPSAWTSPAPSIPTALQPNSPTNSFMPGNSVSLSTPGVTPYNSSWNFLGQMQYGAPQYPAYQPPSPTVNGAGRGFNLGGF